MPSLYEALLQTSIAWVTNLNTGTDFATGRTPDAVHSILPASLGIPLQMNNTATSEWLANELPGLRNYTTVPVEDIPTIIDADQRMITMHLKGAGQSDIGPYQNEYIWILKTTEDGRAIEESWEYIDSFLTLEYWEGKTSSMH